MSGICDYMAKGRENAITRSRLAELLEMDPRKVSQVIEAARRNGVPICASTTAPAGYFLASNQAEMQQYCSSLSRRVSEVHKTLTACENTISTLPE